MFVTLFAIFVVLIAFLVKYNYSYWKRQGFPQDETSTIPWGVLTPVVKRETSSGQCMCDAYFRTKGDFVGIYMLYRPALLIRNVELARDILITNFNSFHDRGVYDGGKSDPLNSNLFTQKGMEWKSMRTKLSPSFTTGKLKAMFDTSNKVGTKLVDYLNFEIGENGVKEFNIKDVFTTYAIDIIASVVFGLEVNGFKHPNNEFRNIVKESTENSIKNILIIALSFLVPGTYKYLAKFGFGNDVLVKLRVIMKDSIELRQKNDVVHKDILQLLMQLQAQGEISAEDDFTIKSNSDFKNYEHFTLDHLTSQSFVFYIAGQETTAATASFTIAEMAMHPEILKKAQKDVDEVMEKHNGIFSYEALQEMEYLELCMKETLRKYPGLPMLNRECTQDFKIPGTDKIIKKGTPIILPIMAYQRDPENFPDPDDYIPDRFLSSNSNTNRNAYMPFGEGPRLCIAARLGKINSKLAVAKVLYSFIIEPMQKRIYEVEPQAVTILAKGGIHVKLSKKRHLS